MTGASGKKPGSKPDWVDVLLAASLAAWGTIFGGVLAYTLIIELANANFQSLPTKLFQVAAVAVFSLPLTIIACVLIGLPALGPAKLLRLSQWWQFAVGGGCVGLLLSSPVMMVPLARPSLLMTALLSWGALAGAFAGVAAWREQTKGASRP